MCGIAGVVDFGGRPAAEFAGPLSRMEAALAHRGPDGWGRTLIGAGTVLDVSPAGAQEFPRVSGPAQRPTVGLAHRRLAIIDLTEGGHQPMATRDLASWMVYNGELYNYRALRRGLVETGAEMRTASDTEVLLWLLASRDVGALTMLRGMFAFAWWDERRSRLVLARDRFGIKPLVFARSREDAWAFASEPRALAAGGFATLEPDAACGAEMLARGSVPVDGSLWRGVEVVAPGEIVTIAAGGVRRESYWSLESVLCGATRRSTVREAADVTRDALAASVEAHLVSDVPVGLFLSGGIDSTALLATVRHIGAGPIRTFTVTMGNSLDEADAARESARQFGGEHTELRVNDLDLDATLDEFFAAMSEPTVDGLNSFIVARAAREAGVRVVLSGVGGDELFGGYSSFVNVPRLSKWLRAIGPAGRASLALAARFLPDRRAEKIRALAGSDTDVAALWWHYRAVTPNVPLNAQSPMCIPQCQSPILNPQSQMVGPFSVVRYLEFREYLERQLLRDADAFTMCRALELRTPLVDHVLVEAVAAAGEWPRGAARSHKAALFGALPDLTRPGAVAARKQGFVLPMARWMRDALTTPTPTQWRDFRERLSAAGHETTIDRFLAGRIHWSRLWAPYVLARVRNP